jgi:hypothetical protein
MSKTNQLFQDEKEKLEKELLAANAMFMNSLDAAALKACYQKVSELQQKHYKLYGNN